MARFKTDWYADETAWPNVIQNSENIDRIWRETEDDASLKEDLLQQCPFPEVLRRCTEKGCDGCPGKKMDEYGCLYSRHDRHISSCIEQLYGPKMLSEIMHRWYKVCEERGIRFPVYLRW